MSSSNYKSNHSGRSGGRILYDAHGTRVKSSVLSNKYVRFLLFGLLPYLVINGVILLLVCATPRVNVEVKNTDDYVSTEVDFTIKSILPLKDLQVSLESEPVEYEKSGSTYKCFVKQNGTFAVEAKSINGMTRMVYTDVSMLDDTAPSVDESSINIERGLLHFTISDTQSGVNYDSVYAIINDSEEIYPSEIDKSLGYITMTLPKNTEFIELHFEDMVGNARSGRISVTVSDEVEEYVDEDEVIEENGESAESALGEESAA